jgi:two-component system, cell cycle response regulator
MKILLADDDVTSLRLTQGLLLKWDYEVITAKNGTEALAIMKSPGAPRLALIDWMMPEVDGPTVCRELRMNPYDAYVYLVLLTAKGGKQSVIEGLESGADDYLTKPVYAGELRARLRVGLRVLDLEDNLVKAREVMSFKASHDALTGVWNRGAIIELAQRELQRVEREQSSLGMVLMDVDHFKKVNDTMGHLAGDEVLREVTNRMSRAVRSYDLVGRYGGEEFLILLPGCTAAAAQERGERIRAEIAREPVETSAGTVRVTLSGGTVATAEFAAGGGPDALLQAADEALYRAKERGRNRVEAAEPRKHPVLAENTA